MAGRKRRIIQTEPRQRAGTKILHHDVGPLDQAVEDLAPFLVLEVERDALLVAVDAQEVGAFALEKRRPPGTGIVAPARLFDLDDPRAHVAKQHGAVGPREHAGQVEHENAIERRHNDGVIIVYAGSA